MDTVYIAEVLLHLTKETARAAKTSAVKPCPAGEKGEMQVCENKLYFAIVPDVFLNAQVWNMYDTFT